MEQFWAFLKKEFWHILRDKRTMLILLVMPVVLIVLFGYAVTTEVKNTRVAVLDLAKDEATARAIGHIAANRYFSLSAQADCMADGRRPLLAGERPTLPWSSARTLPPGRSNPPCRYWPTGHEPQPRPPCARATCSRSWPGACLRQAKRPAIRPRRAGVAIVTRLLYNPQSRSEYNFVPGVIGLILMLICVMMTSISIVREKETGTMEVYAGLAPLPPACIVLAKLVPLLPRFLPQTWPTILLLSVSVLHIPVAGSLPGLVGVLAALHPGVALPRPAHLDGRSQPTGGHAAVVADDCPGHLPLRHHVPGGEYAPGVAVRVGSGSHALVRRGGPQADDTGRADGLRGPRGACPAAHGRSTAVRGVADVQNKTGIRGRIHSW